MAFFIPLLAQGARMIATQGIKKAAVSAVKKKAIGAVKNRAKNFVTGKGKKRKGKKGVASKGGDLVSSVGGGLVKSGSVGSNFIPKGGALVKSPSGSLSTGDGAGGISFEAMSTTLDSIVSLTSQIENIVESQYKNRKAANQEARKEKDKGKKKIREGELESKKKKPGSGLLGKVAQTAKGFSLGGFLMNILMGGVALALFKSWGKIKKLFDFLGKKLTSFWDMLRYSVIALSTAFRKPTKWVATTAGKILKKGGNLIKNAWKSLNNIFKGGFTKLSNSIASWGQSIWKKLTSLTTSSAAQGTKGASRATGVGKRGFKGKGANNIVPGPKNLSKAKPNPKSFTQNIAKSTGTKFQKSGLTRLAKVSNVFKKIPVIGALLGIGIDLALGERLDNAIFGALGASLGAWIGGGVGSLIFPLLGTFAGAVVGGMIGDWLGKELYKTMSGQVSGLATGPQDGDERYNEKGEKEVYSAEKNEWVITSTSTTTSTTNNTSSLPPGSVPAGTLNLNQLVHLAKAAGANDSEAIRLASIAMYESGGNSNAHNPKYPDNSYGLWQVNMLDEPGYMLGEERRNRYKLSNNEQLWDPARNAKIALDILRTSGWSAWSTDKLVTQKDLDAAKKALNEPPPQSYSNLDQTYSSGTGGDMVPSEEGTRTSGDLGKFLKQSGVGSWGSGVWQHPWFGGSPRRSYPSWHNVDRAIDIGGNWPEDQRKILPKIAEFNANHGVKPVELLYGKPGTPKAGTHNDHVHVAYHKGGMVPGRGERWAKLLGGEMVIDVDSAGPAKDMLLAINQASGRDGVMKAIKDYAPYEAVESRMIPVPVEKMVPVPMPSNSGGIVAIPVGGGVDTSSLAAIG